MNPVSIGVILLLGATLAHAQESCVTPGRYFHPALQQTVPVAETLRRVSKRRVVLLGEHHDNAEHHRWQLHTVAALAAIRPKIALGLEMVPRRLQPVLDRWSQGQLSEDEFVKQLDWDAIWSFDIQYYLPLFHLARMQRIPLYALNVERELFTRVTREGWDAIPQNLREGVTTPAPASKEYLRFLAASFLGHNPPDASSTGTTAAQDGEKFLRFVQGQLLWDRAMADGLAEVAQSVNPPLVIGVMGSGHLVNRYGVPDQLKQLAVTDVAVLVPWDAHFDCAQLNRNFADGVFGLDIEVEPPP
ncbi:MAG: ChaN family lipoprotein [Gammaproteobacteria bacterium]|nr:ChaN family lipoprotein [Gammaproteobacteria bacterium]